MPEEKRDEGSCDENKVEIKKREVSTDESISRRSFMRKLGLGTAGLAGMAMLPSTALELKSSYDLEYFGNGSNSADFLVDNEGSGQFKGNLTVEGNHTVKGGTTYEGDVTFEGNLDLDENQIVNIGVNNIQIGDGDGDVDFSGAKVYNGELLQVEGLGVTDSLSTAEDNVDDYDIYVQNDVLVDGNIVGAGGDLAENIGTESGKDIEPGTVVVISGEMEVSPVKKGKDRKVAGIVSTDPGVILKRKRSGVPLALSGIVPTKVSTENGDISPGDLLVSASKEGNAMKCDDPVSNAGAIIGKALEAADENRKIEVLVTLA